MKRRRAASRPDSLDASTGSGDGRAHGSAAVELCSGGDRLAGRPRAFRPERSGGSDESGRDAAVETEDTCMEASSLSRAARTPKAPAARDGAVYPRFVTPGIENQEHVKPGTGTQQDDGPDMPPPGVYVGLDWIRLTGDEGMLREIEALLEACFGVNSESNHGAKWFKRGLVWEPGVLLSSEHQNKICQVDIQGSRLRLMEGDFRVELLRRLMEKGLRVTRIDGALDLVDQRLSVCENAETSCRKHELCHLRRYSPNNEYKADGEPTRLMLKLGARTSPVCARIYDKGLEQGVALRGRWERIEIEWKEDRAATVGQELYYANDEWASRLVSLVLGALDFRERNGRTELTRRPQAAWWKRVVAGRDTAQVAPKQDDQSFERWCEWFRTACGPRLLELADSVNEPVAKVVRWLLEGVPCGERGGPIVDQFQAAFTARNTT